MTHPPEPIPDLEIGHRCPQCGDHCWPDTDRWRCDHCRVTWTPDGTGGAQT